MHDPALRFAVFLWFWAETQDEWLYTALDYSVSKNTVTHLLLAPLVLLGFLFMYVAPPHVCEDLPSSQPVAEHALCTKNELLVLNALA